MRRKRRSGLLGAVLLMAACVLAVAACNSNSVSGNQPKTSSSTNAETKSSSSAGASPRSQGVVGAAISQTR